MSSLPPLSLTSSLSTCAQPSNKGKAVAKEKLPPLDMVIKVNRAGFLEAPQSFAPPPQSFYNTVQLPPIALPSLKQETVIKVSQVSFLELPKPPEPPLRQLPPLVSSNEGNKIAAALELIRSQEMVISYPNGDRYIGDVRGGKRWGLGRMENAKGELLCEGEFKNDLLNGFGIKYFDDGLCYEGIFLDDKFHGYGLCREINRGGLVTFQGYFYHGLIQYGTEPYDDNRCFTGTYDSKGEMESGILLDVRTFEITLFKNNQSDDLLSLCSTSSERSSISSASGSFLPPLGKIADSPQLTSCLIERVEDDYISYPNGNQYFGSTLAGKRDGLGEMMDADGNISYNGCFKDDLPEGFGIANFPGGAYVGSFSKGRYHGFGELKVENGWIAGLFQDGVIDVAREMYPGLRESFFGKYVADVVDDGVLVENKAARVPRILYRGKFKGNEPHGSPIVWKRGDLFFRGNCVFGKFQEIVTMQYPNGDVQMVNFVDDKPRGLGIMMDKKGNLINRDDPLNPSTQTDADQPQTK
jgi:hypothetical protein